MDQSRLRMDGAGYEWIEHATNGQSKLAVRRPDSSQTQGHEQWHRWTE